MEKEIIENIINSEATDVFHASYDEEHCKIVESGLESIENYYKSVSLHEKRTILFCMERYLDPYYENDLSHKEQLISWLKSEFHNNANMEIRQDIYELLLYSGGVKGYAMNNDGYVVQKKWWQFWK